MNPESDCFSSKNRETTPSSVVFHAVRTPPLLSGPPEPEHQHTEGSHDCNLQRRPSWKWTHVCWVSNWQERPVPKAPARPNRPDNTFWSHPGSSDCQTKEPTAPQELRDSEQIQSPQWHRLTQLHWAATRSPSLSRNRAKDAHAALDGWTQEPGMPPTGGTAQLAQCRG